MTGYSGDPHIERIETRQDRICSGMGVGIILLDETYPGFPGDMRNPSAYPFPIQYETCEGLDLATLWSDERGICLDAVLRAAKKLERMGCRAIAGECGLFGFFQRDVAGAVAVPVFMSPLLQVPFIQQTIGPDRSVGILTQTSGFISDALLESVGVDPRSNIVIGGVRDDFGCTAFDNLWDLSSKPSCRFASWDEAESQIVRAAQEFVTAQPAVGALLLNCTGHPPFARAIQCAINLPVYSAGTLLDYAFSATMHRRYLGYA